MKRAMITLIFAALFSTGQLQAQNKKLIDYVNSLPFRDYIILSKEQSEALRPLLPNTNYHGEPEVILKKSPYVSHDLIVVSIADLMSIPGASSAVVHFFRADGEPVETVSFNTGYRQYVSSVQVRKCPDLPELLVEIRTGGRRQSGAMQNHFERTVDWMPRQPDTYSRRQTYAFQNNNVKLVRFTDTEGSPQQNRYDYRHFTCGPLRHHSYEDIKKLLQSTSEIDQLHIMTWLNGKHFSDDMRNWQGHQNELEDSITSYQRARKSKEIHDLLGQRQKSSNIWVSGIAALLKYEFEQLVKTYSKYE